MVQRLPLLGRNSNVVAGLVGYAGDRRQCHLGLTPSGRLREVFTTRREGAEMERLQRYLSNIGGVGGGGAATSDTPMVDTSEQVYISSLALLKMLKHGATRCTISLTPSHHAPRVGRASHIALSHSPAPPVATAPQHPVQRAISLDCWCFFPLVCK
jgi:hypothetical protein